MISARAPIALNIIDDSMVSIDGSRNSLRELSPRVSIATDTIDAIGDSFRSSSSNSSTRLPLEKRKHQQLLAIAIDILENIQGKGTIKNRFHKI